MREEYTCIIGKQHWVSKFEYFREIVNIEYKEKSWLFKPDKSPRVSTTIRIISASLTGGSKWNPSSKERVLSLKSIFARPQWWACWKWTGKRTFFNFVRPYKTFSQNRKLMFLLRLIKRGSRAKQICSPEIALHSFSNFFIRKRITASLIYASPIRQVTWSMVNWMPYLSARNLGLAFLLQSIELLTKSLSSSLISLNFVSRKSISFWNLCLISLKT